MKELVNENGLSDKVELSGAFCMGHCKDGVCVTVDGKLYSVSPETVDDFFKNNVLAKV
jgi:NADH:ubiquinone oxidoreductase subunit E